MMSADTETFHSFAALKAGGDLVDFTYTPLPLTEDQVEVCIDACGVCHSDLHQKDDNWGLSHYPLVPGHEIIGRIVAMGSNVHRLRIGQRVGVGPQIGSCQRCEACRTQRESLCKNAIQVYNTATGNPAQSYTYGGLSDRIRCPAAWTFPIPEGLDTVNAAPLLCAGQTVWAPFMRHGVRRGDAVGIIGIGGLGHLAIQFASALGYETTAISTSPSKKDESLRMGAAHFLNIDDGDQVQSQFGTFDFLLATISATIDWTVYLRLLKPEGKLCLVGMPDRIGFSPIPLVLGQLTFVGSLLAPKHEIELMLRFAADHNIQAMTEVLPMNARNCNEAMSRISTNSARYRIVLVNSGPSGHIPTIH